MTSSPASIPMAKGRSVTFWEHLLVFLTGLLFGLRYFQPTENADAGETLWITWGWLVLITGCSILYALKKINLDYITRTPWDIAVGLLCGGHILNGLLVCFTQGNKFYAINLTAEWLGLWAIWKLLRICTQIEGVKQALICGLVGISLSLTLLGLYQYHIFYPDLRDQIQPLFQEYDKLSAQDSKNEKTVGRLREIQQQFAQLGLPEGQAERNALAQRMFFSTEIFGYFALANTLAGILLVAAIFSSQVVRGLRNSPDKLGSTLGVICQLLIIYGIYLTKSRTALVAWFVSTSVLLFYVIWLKPLRTVTTPAQPRLRQTALIVSGFLFLVGLMLMSFSKLDQKVISEAPKSLQYRMEYWTGTWQIIKENPLVGCRLGQFRPAYLQHKLLGSSEEIKDPHQMLLDVWVNGGLIAFVGILLMCILVLQGIFRLHLFVSRTMYERTKPGYITKVLYIGLGFSMIVTYIYHLSIEESLSEFIFLQLIGYVLWIFIVSHIHIPERYLNQAGVLAVLGLIIHLQAAGGIGMPAIVQTLFLGICCMIPINPVAGGESLTASQLRPAYHRYLAPVVPTLATVLCLQFSLIPFYSGREYFNLAAKSQDFESREAFLKSAQKSSPHQPEFAFAIANLTLEKLKYKQATLEQFLQTLDQVIAIDPLNPRSYRQAGTYCDQLYTLWKQQIPQLTAIPILVEKTNLYYKEALKRYPHDGKFAAQYAIYLHASSQLESCREISQLALKIHQTNEANRHVDIMLPRDTIQLLESFID